MKAIMLSIRPEWCEKIISGKKTIELRKSRPNLKTPFKCYIYCTLNGSNELFKETLGGDIARWNREKWADRKGNVIGEFACDAILSHCEMANADLAEQQSCVRREKIREYAGDKEVFGWHISDLVIYDEPRDLSEFYKKCDKGCEDCELWQYIRVNADEFDMECSSDFYGHKPLTRPPQSWCYVEE